jgi:hypothetical protein
MTRKLIVPSVLALAALSLSVGAASAQEREGNGRRRESGRAVQQGTAQRREAPPRAAARSSEARQEAAPRGEDMRSYRAPQAAPREYRSPQPSARQAVPRAYRGNPSPAYRYDDHRGYAQPRGGDGRYGGHAYVVPHDFHPYRPLYFSHPYYGFHPHLNLGFGLWLGVTVPYPWSYFGAYMPRVYGYYGEGYYGAGPGVRQYGGLSFDIQPYDASLFVDGEYVGTVGTFTPYGEPLTLWPGVHHIAIVRDGYRTMEWDVTVEPGQVIPYRGTLSQW